MPRFFTDNIDCDHIEIVGQDARHIALSLRMKIGDSIIFCDGKGQDAECILESISPESVSAAVKKRFSSVSEPKTKVVLFQALPKSDKMEYIVQKSVELGVAKIIPVLTSRCISRPDEKTMNKKIDRLQKISDEAAKQSGRGILPKIGNLMNLKEALKEMSTYDLPILFYEHAEEPLSKTMENKEIHTIAVFIGSEGGFSEEEAKLAKEYGLHVTSLGPRILRCETAPVAGISAIMYAMGEMQ